MLYVARPWFWFYQNFVDTELEQEEIRYIQGAIEEEPEEDTYHVILRGTEHHSFESLQELKRFIKEYEE